MTSSTEAYAIVDNRDDIILGSLSSTRQGSWDALFHRLNYTLVFKNRDSAKSKGFKCVRITLQTEDYKR